MTMDEFDRALLGFLRRKPFQPFTVVMDTGERFVVVSPQNGVAVVHYARCEGWVFSDGANVPEKLERSSRNFSVGAFQVKLPFTRHCSRTS